jgi:hypothetical protein
MSISTWISVPFAAYPVAAATLIFACGCESKPSLPSVAPPVLSGRQAPPAATKPADDAGEHADHEHAHTAPHGGTLIALGDHVAHLELVLDAATGKLSGFVLDGEAEKGVRIAQDVLMIHIEERRLKGATEGDRSPVKVELAAVANALTGEKPGDTSEFVATSNTLKGVERFLGFVDKITVKGQEFLRVSVTYPDGNE